MKFLFLFLIIWHSATEASATTFIGNGGSAGDVELLVTKKQILTTLKTIHEQSGNSILCTCAKSYTNHSLCESLNQLKDSQILFCSRFLKEHSKIAYDHLAQANIFWTHKKIEVQGDHKLNAADAVTNPKTNRVTLNLARFLKLNPSERVFLLAHEVFHYTKWQGAYIKDTGPIGPFKESLGQRKFLNAVATGVLMQVEQQNLFRRYRPALRRPKAWKKNYLEVSLGSLVDDGDEKRTPYYVNSFDYKELSFRRYFGTLGIIARFRSSTGTKQVRTAIEVTEELKNIGFGGTWRYFPFSDPLTFLGQSHGAINIFAEVQSASTKVADPFVGTEDDTKSLGVSVEAKYNVPIYSNIWISGGIGISYHNYSFDKLGINYDTPRSYTGIGASYGF